MVLLIAALGHNSFSKVCEWFGTLPAAVAATQYYPYGVLEMLGFIRTFALVCIDDLGNYLRTAAPSLQEIPLFILARTWRAYLAILVLLAIAAAIECWVTPLLVQSAYEHVLSGMGISSAAGWMLTRPIH